VYDVCVRTGDGGADATGKFSYPDLLPDIFAGPYLSLEPGLAFVLDDGRRAVGYVLGTADTPRFVCSYRQEWLPRIAGVYPEPSGPPVSPDDELLVELRTPERMVVPGLASYPAHLHIDILPGNQGRGWGRRLIETFVAAASCQGAAGVHVCVAKANTRAMAFYERVGFETLELEAPDTVVFYGLRTAH
jgi:ribosomal protein S18 acetylase RimI-like enzyme